jgi:subtilisin-like proprotein convertase family protein
MQFARRMQANLNPRTSIPVMEDLRSPFNCTLPGIVAGIKVSLDIDHEFLRQLEARIISPGGAMATLFKRLPSREVNMRQTFTGQALSSLVGVEAQGTWTLQVIDHVGRGSGRLNSWNLELDLRRECSTVATFESARVKSSHRNRGLSTSMVTVPKSAGGSASSLSQFNIGIEAAVEFISDFNITLASPALQTVRLEKLPGWTKRGNIWRISVLPVEALSQQPISGDWTLSIENRNAEGPVPFVCWFMEIGDAIGLQGAETVIGPHAVAMLAKSGIRSADALHSALPLEISSILSLAGHADPTGVATRLCQLAGQNS